MRVQSEQTYGLRQPDFKGSRTWAYALTDVSRANVQALVTDPAAEDTHNINRIKFRPGLFTPRLPYQIARPWIPASVNLLSVLLLVGGTLVCGLALAEFAAPPALLARPRLALQSAVLAPHTTAWALARRLTHAMSDRIPAGSAESAALFRIVFGVALLALLLDAPTLGVWAAAPENVLSAPHRALLGIFVQAPWVARGIAPWLVWWGVMFVVGLLTRTAFAMLTAGAFAWALLYTTRAGHHTVCALLLALLFLQGSRWGDAWSVDAWRRGRVGLRRATPQQYGYTIWLPSFVLGLAFAAAAAAKLREGGLGWILNGTAKYHFVSDSRQALVDWGLHLGQHPWMAVVFSFAAIAIEGLVIVGVVSRAYRYRFAAGAASLSLLVGFALFQGLFWPAWWILLLSFLPWHLVGRNSATAPGTSGAPVSRPVVAAAMALVALQLVVTSLKLEVTPLLSTYDMYSTTYESPEDYERKAGSTYWIVASLDGGGVDECVVSRNTAESLSRALDGDVTSTPAVNVLEACFGTGTRVQTIAVEGRRSKVDWNKWPPGEVVHQPMAGPVDLP
jgi:hypothetical protein